MSTNAANWVFGPIYSAEQTLLKSASFLARIDAEATATEGARHIHRQYLADEFGDLAARRPFAVLALAEEELRQFGTSTGGQHLIPAGSVILLLSDNARHDDDHNASAADFLAWAGSVLEELATLAGQGGNLFFSTAEMVLPPNRTPRKQRQPGEDHWEIAWVLHYGVGEV